MNPRLSWWLTALVGVLLITNRLSAQPTDTLRHGLIIDVEVRPRTEYRANYRWALSESTTPTLYTTQRNRISLTYLSNRLQLHVSPQEIHSWGELGGSPRVGSVNFFELYAEPRLGKYLSLRLGRQALSLDNGRLFSAAPWGQQSRSHEGLRLLYKREMETDLTLALTRPYGTRFESTYSPVASHTYKLLVVYHLKHRFNKHLALTTINAVDVFQPTGGQGLYYQRFTQGGRLEYSRRSLYGTISAYYQYGQTTTGLPIVAYYSQPEIRLTRGRTSYRLGAELLSGDKSAVPGGISRSFVPLYGVAWKFMGNMNLFTRFPADVANKGLINPYLFISHQANKKLSLRGDAHLFYSQYPLLAEGQEVVGTYLGFESDLSVNYRPFKGLEVNYGFSFALVSPRMELLNKVVNAETIPVWSYLMLSYAPRLLSRNWIKIRD